MDAASIKTCGCVILLVEVVLCSLLTASTNGFPDMSTAILINVDQSGNGDFMKIQDAIDAVPSNNSELYFIAVRPGIYREKIVVPPDKPFITLSGMQMLPHNTIITWDESDGNNIYKSPTLSILASDFVGRYLTIQNTFGRGSQAVALSVSGDRAAFYACRILSYQDTLHDDFGRHYYKLCYIEGDVDFIFGNAASLYEGCHLHSTKDHGIGSVTAQRRNLESENTGFIFLSSKITGVGQTFLGRPWGPYSRVVFEDTYMSSTVVPRGWDDWRDPSTHRTVYYGEYKCFGPGANRSGRVGWSRSLSDTEAAYLAKDIIGGGDWLRPPVPPHFKKRPAIINKRDGKN